MSERVFFSLLFSCKVDKTLFNFMNKKKKKSQNEAFTLKDMITKK